MIYTLYLIWDSSISSICYLFPNIYYLIIILISKSNSSASRRYCSDNSGPQLLDPMKLDHTARPVLVQVKK